MENMENLIETNQKKHTDMTTAETLREKMLAEFGIEYIGFVRSETDYGVSEYLTFYFGESLIKIRVSDHCATNAVRVEKEIMFKSTDSIEKMLYTVEQIIFPERFEFRPCENGERPTHIKNGQKVVITRI